MEYRTPSPAPTKELVFTQTSFGATDMESQVFSTLVHAEEYLTFSGQVDAAMPERAKGRLEFMKARGDKMVRYRGARIVIERTEDAKGFRFYTDVQVPAEAGVYVISVTVGDALVALGELVVKKPESHP